MLLLNRKLVDTSKRFPDGTSAMKIDPEEFGIDNDCDAHIVWYYDGDEAEMIHLYYLVSHLRSYGVKEIFLTMPYIPNARNDRAVNADDVFTLRYFADFINNLGLTKVFVRDPHSHVAEALIHNVIVFDVGYYIRSVIDHLVRRGISTDSLVMFYPDEGAMKRYHAQSPLPDGFGVKTRDWRTGQITGLQLIHPELVKDKNVLIVDDICSRGGTFFRSAQALKEAGAKDIYLFVTHCENTIEQGDLLSSDLISHVYTTHSIYTGHHEKITVMA